MPGIALELMDAVIELMHEASAVALAAKADLGVEMKSDGSLVTHADRRVEAFFRDKLPKLLPGSTVWGEEEGFREPGPEGLWALDPIDGTSNFRFGAPQWGISLGLIRGDRVELGAIAMPDLGKLYHGWMGGGAFLNGNRLPDLIPGPIRNEELVSYGDLTLHRYGDRVPGKMRYQGAFVADAAMFVEGVYRAMLSDKAALYDAAASIVLALEVGAEVRFADGEPFCISELLNVKPFPKALALLPPESGFILK